MTDGDENRGQCVICADECISFTLNPYYPSEGRYCYCEHEVSQHLPQAPLPAKGGCPQTGCPGFLSEAYTAQAVCQRPTCNRRWLQHLNISTPPEPPHPVGTSFHDRQIFTSAGPASQPFGQLPPARVVASQPPAALWTAQPTSTSRSTNDRRIEAAKRHTSAAVVRKRNGYIVPTRTGASVDNKFEILIYPHPIWSSDFENLESPPPKSLRIFPRKWGRFFETCEQKNLVIKLQVADTPEPIHADFDNAIMEHCLQYHLELPGSQIPAGRYTKGVFSSYLWQVVVPGNAPKEGSTKGQLLKAGGLAPYEFTHLKLRTLGTKLKHPVREVTLIVIAPVHGSVWGPIPNVTTLQHHACYAFHVMMGFEDDSMVEDPDRPPIQCLEACPVEDFGGEFNNESDSDDFLITNTVHPNQPRRPSAGHATSSSTPVNQNTTLRSAQAVLPQNQIMAPRQRSVEATTSGTHLAGRTNLGSSRRPRVHSLELSDDVLHPFNRRRLNIPIQDMGPQLTSPISIRDTVSPPPQTDDFTPQLHESPEEWVDSIQSLTQHIPHEDTLFVTGPSVEAVAQAMTHFIMVQYGSRDAKLPQHFGVTIRLPNNNPLRNLFARSRSWSIGPAHSSGQGVERAVLTRMIQDMVQLPTDWRLARSTYHELALLPGNSSLERLSRMKAYGTICALFMYYVQLGPYTVSPHLILVALEGEASIINLDFAEIVDSEGADTLRPWPLNHSVPLDVSRVNHLVIEVTGRTAEPLRDLAPEDRQEVTLMLYRSVLFGPSTPQLSSSKDMQAFKDGFNVQLSDNVSLIQSIGPSGTTLLSQMYNNRIRQPDELIQCFEYTSIDHPREDNWKKAFHRYLVGQGHPDHPHLAEAISTEEREKALQNPCFRCESFLNLATGSILRGHEQDKTINLRFVDDLPNQRQRNIRPRNAPEDFRLDPTPIYARACFKTVYIPLVDRVCELLNQPLPADDSTATDFDSYIHTCINNVIHVEDDPEFDAP